MLGTAKLLRDEKMHPVELREAVTSPGGTTIRAIRELERAGVRAAFLNAIQAAMERSTPARGGRAVSLRLEIVADAEAAARFVAERLAEVARGGRHLVLTGGGTPGRAYELAAQLEPNWSNVETWWGDDRCVPPDDERSNFGMATQKLLDRLERPPAAVHRIRGEDDPDIAAADYEQELRGVTLDLVLNGIGPDAHTASLFPNAPALDIRDRLVVPAAAGDEPFVQRITMTIPALENCRSMIFMVVGDDKADAARRAFGDPPSPDAPSSLVRSKLGDTIAVLDREAAAQLG